MTSGNPKEKQENGTVTARWTTQKTVRVNYAPTWGPRHSTPSIPSSLRSETKRSEIQVYFFAFFTFFSLFSLFPLFFAFFRLIFVSLRFFRLFYLRFRFRFLVFRIEVNHVKSGFFFASKRNEIFASISNFASEAKVRAHPSPFLLASRTSSPTNRKFFLPVP